MKTGKNLLVLAAVCMISLFFISCNDDDGYSLDKYWVNIATVENQDHSSYFFFDLDDGTRMWTAATALPYYRPDNGQRIVANYTILSDRASGSSYDHDVRLNSVYEILTKNIVDVTSENDDELGNDPIEIEDIWIGSNYLNVEFVFAGYNRTHFINMARDASNDYNDGKVHLEFRHNAYNDSPSYALWGLASFSLESLQQVGTASLPLVIHVNDYASGAEKTYELTYNFNESSSENRAIEVGENTAEIE